MTDLNYSFEPFLNVSENEKRKARKAVFCTYSSGDFRWHRAPSSPFERVKIEYMLDSTKITTDGGVLGSLKRIVRTEGAPALFRGNL